MNNNKLSGISEQIKYNMSKLGVVYDYKKKIPKPSSLNVSSNSKVKYFIGDVKAIGTYVDYLTKGPAIGNRYQFKAGWCKDGITPRMVTVDNIPSGAVHLPGIPSYTLGSTNLRGLIPGLYEDIWQISPGNLLQYMQGKGQIYSECFGNMKNGLSKKMIIFYIFLLSFIIMFCYIFS